MSVSEQENAAERRALRNRITQMQRAVAAIELAVDGLSLRERMIVLNDALEDALNAARALDAAVMQNRRGCA